MTDLGVRAVRAEVVVTADTDLGFPDSPESLLARTTLRIEPDEPAFEGHYPGFPILPGVCVIECVHRSALATHPQRAAVEPRLVAIETARFLAPVYPGDEISVELRWERAGDDWRCRAVVACGTGENARVRLRYASEPR